MKNIRINKFGLYLDCSVARCVHCALFSSQEELRERIWHFGGCLADCIYTQTHTHKIIRPTSSMISFPALGHLLLFCSFMDPLPFLISCVLLVIYILLSDPVVCLPSILILLGFCLFVCLTLSFERNAFVRLLDFFFYLSDLHKSAICISSFHVFSAIFPHFNHFHILRLHTYSKLRFLRVNL